jgi:putative hydrolase of the HAD superfamily
MRGPGEFRGVTAVTFDAAGTLLRPHPSVGAVYREVALRHGRACAEADLDREFRRAFQVVSKCTRGLDPEARERDFWRRVVTEAFGPLGGAPEPFDVFFEELWETFGRGDRWQVFPRAVETLCELQARGYRLGILSNWDARLHSVLAQTGLREHFDAVVISSEAGAEKPDTGIFRVAEAALGVAPAACLHVGDSRRHDLAGAQAAGWKAVIVRHDGPAAEAVEIEGLAALLDGLHGPARQRGSLGRQAQPRTAGRDEHAARHPGPGRPESSLS